MDCAVASIMSPSTQKWLQSNIWQVPHPTSTCCTCPSLFPPSLHSLSLPLLSLFLLFLLSFTPSFLPWSYSSFLSPSLPSFIHQMMFVELKKTPTHGSLHILNPLGDLRLYGMGTCVKEPGDQAVGRPLSVCVSGTGRWLQLLRNVGLYPEDPSSF